MQEFPCEPQVESNVPTIDKYIQCSTNQEFSIEFTLKAPFIMTSTAIEELITVDGKTVGSTILKNSLYNRNGLRIGHSVEGFTEGSTRRLFIRKFKFVEIVQSQYYTLEFLVLIVLRYLQRTSCNIST